MKIKESSIKPKEKSDNINLFDCLNLFVKEETLEKGNEWYCNKCKDHKLATKKVNIIV